MHCVCGGGDDDDDVVRYAVFAEHASERLALKRNSREKGSKKRFLLICVCERARFCSRLCCMCVCVFVLCCWGYFPRWNFY